MSSSPLWWPPLLAATISAIILLISHIRAQRWKQAEFVRQAFQERYDSPGARNASSLLYWGDRDIPLWEGEDSARWQRVTDQEAAKAILPYVIYPFRFTDPKGEREHDKRRIALNDSFVDLIWRLDHVRASAKAASVEDVHEVIRELGELLDNSGICSRLAPLDRLVLPAFRVMIAWRKMDALIGFFDTHGFDIRPTPADIERLRDRFPDLNWGRLHSYDVISSLPRRLPPHWRISRERQGRSAALAWSAAKLHRIGDNVSAALRFEKYSQPSLSPPELYHQAGLAHEYSVALERRLDRTLDLTVHSPGHGTQSFPLDPADHQSFQGLYRLLARRFGTRMPKSDRGSVRPVQTWSCTPLLTENASPTIMYGYGDPSVLREESEEAPTYHLVSTSNDAPNAFPILRSADLRSWEHVGFIFPEGQKPGWALDEPKRSDYWAPNIACVGEKYVACFTARDRNGTLSVGLALADQPTGPYRPHSKPLVGGGAIDGRLFVEGDKTYLIWKWDNNDRWPSALVEILAEEPAIVSVLFDEESDRKTACLAITLWPWIKSLTPMQKFFALQPLIEAVTTRFDDLKERVRAFAETSSALGEKAGALHEAMATPVHVQEVDVDRNLRIGDDTEILRNDRPWEGHVVEAASLEKREGTYFLFYSGNDFSTPDYGIGVATSKAIAGPYHKQESRLLGSSSDWIGPGNPSITVDRGGRDVMLLHAYKPQRFGYNAFRALLLVPIALAADRVALRDGIAAGGAVPDTGGAADMQPGPAQIRRRLRDSGPR